MGTAAVLFWAGIAVSTVPDSVVTFGTMHEALGQGKTQARVKLAELLARESFYAIGAVAGLGGEITIVDSKAWVTGVDGEGRPIALSDTVSATMLVGQSVPKWIQTSVNNETRASQVDTLLADLAAGFQGTGDDPFMFQIDGELTDVRLHVINGACPVHAHRHGLELRSDQRPFVYEASTLAGTVVGVFARDAAGRMTHPQTLVHAHVIFEPADGGEPLTGHLERFGVSAGAVVRIPATR